MPAWNIIQAVNDALRIEMRRDPRVVVMGEDVGKFGGVFRATVGLIEEFGAERVIDTPLAEAGIIGAAMIPASASGVSITRSAPTSSIKPTVARNTPPNFPTSSPITTTRGSRRISIRRASLTA